MNARRLRLGNVRTWAPSPSPRSDEAGPPQQYHSVGSGPRQSASPQTTCKQNACAPPSTAARAAGAGSAMIPDTMVIRVATDDRDEEPRSAPDG